MVTGRAIATIDERTLNCVTVTLPEDQPEITAILESIVNTQYKDDPVQIIWNTFLCESLGFLRMQIIRIKWTNDERSLEEMMHRQAVYELQQYVVDNMESGIPA